MTFMEKPGRLGEGHGVPASGAMEALIRSHAWDATPLGKPEGWPQTLVPALGVCLDCGVPMSIAWGEKGIFLYNDASVPLLGGKHPHALGRPAREVFSDAWDQLEPGFAQVMAGGGAWQKSDVLFLLREPGGIRETYFDFGINPIRNSAGAVEGTLNIAKETTARVLAGRRAKLLYQLVQHAALAQSIDEACKLSAGALAKGGADIAFAMIYVFDRHSEARRAHLAATAGVTPGTAECPTVSDLTPGRGRLGEGEVWPFARVLERGEMEIITGLASRCAPLPGGIWPEPAQTAAVAPLRRNFETEAPSGFIVLGLSPRSPADDAYLEFVRQVVDSVAAAVANVEDREQERQWTASLSARSAIDASLDPLVTISVMGKITDANDATARMTGIPRVQLAGCDFASLFTQPDDARASYMEVLRNGYVNNYPLAIRRGDGEIRDVLYNASVYHDELGHVAGVFAAARDVTELKNTERALQRINRALKALSAGSQVMIHAVMEEQLLNSMCQVAIDAGYRMAFIGFKENDANRTVRLAAWAGQGSGFIETAKFTWGEDAYGGGCTGGAIKTGIPQQIGDAWNDPRALPWREDFKMRGYRSCVSLPLRNATGVFGVLTMYGPEPRTVDNDEMKLLVQLSEELAYGIGAMRARREHDISTKRLQQSMEATVQALSATLEMRDPYTAGHQRRVSQLAVALARRLQLPAERIQGVYLAGLIHDIGKIKVPSEILSKPGRLSPLELELVRAHVEAGYEILKNIDFPWPIADMVRQHHERMDGSGYPHRVKGEDILLESRILAVADVVEAISAHRPYRAALGEDLAVREIEIGRGTIYDADVVDACLALLREGGFHFDVAA